MRRSILRFIDFFYLPRLQRVIPQRTFRYLACGGFSTSLDILVFFLCYHFVLHEQMVHLAGITISPHIAAFLMAFCVSFPTGFSLSKFVVFPDSELGGKVQLMRYFLLVLCCLLLNYVFLKLFVEHLHLFPTVAKILTTLIVALFSYLSQKHFTFRIRSKELSFQE